MILDMARANVGRGLDVSWHFVDVQELDLL
jgi:hypothetical protein